MSRYFTGFLWYCCAFPTLFCKGYPNIGPVKKAAKEFVSTQLGKQWKSFVFRIGSLPLEASTWYEYNLFYWLEIATRSSSLTAQEIRCLLRKASIAKCCAKCLAQPENSSQPAACHVSLHYCQSCLMIRYCSHECQRSHHKQHKKDCPVLNDYRRQECQRQSAVD